MKLVSIIVPIFNNAPYLEHSVASLQSQKHENIEILLIDDGSSDDSLKIAENLAKTESRIKVFHKKNGGASSARNYGLEKMTGEYFCFVDSDDFVDENYVSDMLEMALLSGCEIVCSPRIESEKNGIFERDFVLRDFIYDEKCHYNFYACLKLFRTDLLDQTRFDESIFVGEDFDFTSKMLLKARKIGLLSKPSYHYFYSDTSIMRSNFSPKFDTQIKSFENFINLCKSDFQQFLPDAYYYAVIGL